MTIQVLLADDHGLYAETLALLLSTDERIVVVGHAEDGCQAVEQALRLRPDVVLMDVNMPHVDGIEASRRLHRELPSVRIVMLTSSAAAEDVERACAAGASAYLTKDADGDAIADEVVRVSALEAGTRRAA
ncbi:MAG TPA: response regulator transcription factor [Gaiellaceae bacterium]|nr:response regulator transcription factor [Gaiellaceae bacterium]